MAGTTTHLDRVEGERHGRRHERQDEHERDEQLGRLRARVEREEEARVAAARHGELLVAERERADLDGGDSDEWRACGCGSGVAEREREQVMYGSAMQCNAMQYNTMQCNAMQCNAMQCNAMQCNAMQRNATRCNAMRCNVPNDREHSVDTDLLAAIASHRIIPLHPIACARVNSDPTCSSSSPCSRSTSSACRLCPNSAAISSMNSTGPTSPEPSVSYLHTHRQCEGRATVTLSGSQGARRQRRCQAYHRRGWHHVTPRSSPARRPCVCRTTRDDACGAR